MFWPFCKEIGSTRVFNRIGWLTETLTRPCNQWEWFHLFFIINDRIECFSYTVLHHISSPNPNKVSPQIMVIQCFQALGRLVNKNYGGKNKHSLPVHLTYFFESLNSFTSWGYGVNNCFFSILYLNVY